MCAKDTDILGFKGAYMTTSANRKLLYTDFNTAVDAEVVKVEEQLHVVEEEEYGLLPYTAYITAPAQDNTSRSHEVDSKFSTPTVDNFEGYRWHQKLRGQPLKRLLDIIAAATLLVFVSPCLLLFAILIRLQDRKPAFYSQTRIGLHGQPFECLKLRTMVHDAEAKLAAVLRDNPEARQEWEAKRKLTHDPRITPLGHFLRRSSIDELPQLINVLRGEMSLVGPRPIIADDLQRYGLQAIHYLRVRPGVTGLWQVSGRSDTSYEARVLFDREYSLHRCFWKDVKILFMTVPAVIKARGAT